MSRTATTKWRRVTRQVRKDGAANSWPCHRCGGARGPIDYRTRSEADEEAKAQGAWWLIGIERPLALDVDHVVPHAAGGTDTISNAAPSHAICNREAGAKSTSRRSAKPRPVEGVWLPLTGEGPELPGRARPGTRTRTHEFHPKPHGGDHPSRPRPGVHPAA